MKTILYACADLAYDQIFSPVVASTDIEPVLLSDRRPRFVSGWNWRPMPQAVEGMSPSMANRYAKFFPYKIFPDADYSIYCDANLLIIGDLRPLLDEFIASGADIGLFPHLERSDIYSEFEFGKQVKKILPADYAKGAAQMQFYRDEGLPAQHVLTENAIIFRKHGNPLLEQTMELWWQQLETYTKRDQLSLPYALHKTGLVSHVWDWSYWSDNPYFSRYIHRRGMISDINTFLKNKRHYNAFYRVTINAMLSTAHKLAKPFRKKS